MTASEILKDNLSGIDEKIARLYARLPAHAEEFCDLLCGRLGIGAAAISDSAGAAPSSPVSVDAEELGLIWRALKEELATDARKRPGRAVADAVGALFSDQDAVLAAYTAGRLARRLEPSGPPPADPRGPARTAYFRNSYSDAAFRRFAREFREPTVCYFDSFPAVCEELYAERCDYAILPVESSSDGRLAGIERLTARYELAPVFYTRVRLRDSSREPGGGENDAAGEKDFLRFGLFAASPRTPPHPEAIEIIAFADENFRLCHLLTAADLLGCELTDCRPLPEDRDFQKAYRLVFSEGPRRKEAAFPPLRALSVFLHCEYPHHLLCGLCRELL